MNKMTKGKWIYSIIFPIVLFLISVFIAWSLFNLSFPEYPELTVVHSSKSNIYIESFKEENLPKNEAYSIKSNQININKNVANIKLRLINTGREVAEDITLVPWSEEIWYSAKILEPIKGKNGHLDVEIPLIFKCNNNESCGLNNIPLGNHTIMVQLHCKQCFPSVQQIPFEFCIYDIMNISQGDCVSMLKLFSDK